MLSIEQGPWWGCSVWFPGWRCLRAPGRRCWPIIILMLLVADRLRVGH